eukprot:1302723-Prymnesium_polylepis.1
MARAAVDSAEAKAAEAPAEAKAEATAARVEVLVAHTAMEACAGSCDGAGLGVAPSALTASGGTAPGDAPAPP